MCSFLHPELFKETKNESDETLKKNDDPTKVCKNCKHNEDRLKCLEGKLLSIESTSENMLVSNMKDESGSDTSKRIQNLEKNCV